jgi:MFS family permease
VTTVADQQAMPRPALIGIFGGLFCGYVGLTAAIPVLPGFVRDRFGASDFAVGLAVTATALTALLIRPVAGGRADLHGHRLVMQTGALILAIGGLGYFLPLGLTGLVVDRLLLGIGEAALFTAGAVWTVSLAAHNRRGQLIGLYGVSMWGGITVGTFLGAVLKSLGYHAVWTLCAAAPLLALALISSVPSSPHQPTGTKRGSILPRTTIAPGVALALAAGGYATLAAFVVLHLQARHVHSGVVVLSCFSAVYAGTRLVIGRFPDRYGPRRVATVCAIGEAAGLLIIAAAPNLAVAIAGSLVMGVGFSLLHPSLALMVMNRTDKSQQGAALGAYTSFWDLGVAFWGPVGGLVAGGLGYPAVFVVGAGCALVSAVMALLIAEPTARPVAVAG